MFKILELNKISATGKGRIQNDNYAVSSDEKNPDGVLLRSADMHNMELPEGLLAIARAGAGVNNIPIDVCAEKGIVVFNTPGANANAVKELTIAGLLLASRKIVDGINWVTSLKGETGVAKSVEKGKSAFVGPEILGKKVGVIGLGAIGGLVANACHSLGMDVYGYDPFISVEAAWRLSRGIHRTTSLDTLFTECDYITIHAPLDTNTKYMLNDSVFAKMKKGMRILNFSRADLVDSNALKEAIENETVACYVTDFPTDEIVACKNIITIPHLAASTPESEENCAVMAVDSLAGYLEYGNIKNSVNYPDCEMSFSGRPRICIINKNVPNVIGPITTLLANKNINIENMLNKSKGNYSYSIIDIVCAEVPAGLADELMGIDGVIHVRIIK